MDDLREEEEMANDDEPLLIFKEVREGQIKEESDI